MSADEGEVYPLGKKKKGRVREGRCKLTHCEGRFVDSHLLPKALTKGDELGQGFTQMGNGHKERRFSSWYDSQLVTKEGENILAKYDDWAITELRKHRLIWSGWGPILKLHDYTSLGPRGGIRRLTGGDWCRLRLFFLSLLWRAAATDRPEFREISVPDHDLEQLRLMVLNENPYPLEFYPISLTQFITRGPDHNHTPLATVKKIPNIDEAGGTLDMPFFRFYLDGLILHISRLPLEKNREMDLGPQWVGSDNDNIVLSTVHWEESTQHQNCLIVTAEAILGRPLWELKTGLFTDPTPPSESD
jgi:hypothetical protein